MLAGRLNLGWQHRFAGIQAGFAGQGFMALLAEGGAGLGHPVVAAAGALVVELGGRGAGLNALLSGEVLGAVVGAVHRDALLHRTHQRAEVATHAVFLDNFGHAGAGIQLNGLVGTIFAGGVA